MSLLQSQNPVVFPLKRPLRPLCVVQRPLNPRKDQRLKQRTVRALLGLSAGAPHIQGPSADAPRLHGLSAGAPHRHGPSEGRSTPPRPLSRRHSPPETLLCPVLQTSSRGPPAVPQRLPQCCPPLVIFFVSYSEFLFCFSPSLLIVFLVSCSLKVFSQMFIGFYLVFIIFVFWIFASVPLGLSLNHQKLICTYSSLHLDPQSLHTT